MLQARSGARPPGRTDSANGSRFAVGRLPNLFCGAAGGSVHRPAGKGYAPGAGRGSAVAEWGGEEQGRVPALAASSRAAASGPGSVRFCSKLFSFSIFPSSSFPLFPGRGGPSGGCGPSGTSSIPPRSGGIRGVCSAQSRTAFSLQCGVAGKRMLK